MNSTVFKTCIGLKCDSLLKGASTEDEKIQSLLPLPREQAPSGTSSGMNTDFLLFLFDIRKTKIPHAVRIKRLECGGVGAACMVYTEVKRHMRFFLCPYVPFSHDL